MDSSRVSEKKLFPHPRSPHMLHNGKPVFSSFAFYFGEKEGRKITLLQFQPAAAAAAFLFSFSGAV